MGNAPSHGRLSICEALTQIAFGKAMGLHEVEALSASDLDAMELAGRQLTEAASKGLVRVFGYLAGSTKPKQISPARFGYPIHWQFTHDEFWHGYVLKEFKEEDEDKTIEGWRGGMWEKPEDEKRVGHWEKVTIDGASLATWLSNFPANCAETGPAKELPKRADTKELRRAYEERVANWPKGAPPPSREEDWKFLKALHDGISRDRARDIRKQFAPQSWKERGRRKSGG
jgi:hypothetical protein